MLLPLKHRVSPVIALLLLCVFNVSAADVPRVLATTWWLGEWVEAIAGEQIAVEVVIPASADPHVYQLKPSDLRQMRDIDLLLANGLGLEPWLDDLQKAGGADLKVVEFADITVDSHGELRHTGHGHGHDVSYDPHIWLDPELCVPGIRELEQALVKLVGDSGAEPSWERGAFAKEMSALSNEIRRIIATRSPRILTGHDSFGYFGKRYGIEIVGNIIESCDTHTHDPSARQLKQLSDIVREYDLKRVFTDAQVSSRVVERFARENDLQITRLYSATLDDAFNRLERVHFHPTSHARYYQHMLIYNAKVIADKL